MAGIPNPIATIKSTSIETWSAGGSPNPVEYVLKSTSSISILTLIYLKWDYYMTEIF